MIKLHTNFGVIAIELDAEKAPLSAQNFIDYATAGHYDNTIFHRVIPGFMIQGGGMLPGLKQKAARPPIKNEANNGLKNLRGTLSMARTNVVDSATSQFFISVADNDFLDHQGERNYGYAVFGRVVSGMDTIQKIRNVPTGPGGPFPTDAPQTPVVINSATLVK